MKFPCVLPFVVVSFCAAIPAAAQPLGTGFTYQGELKISGAPAAGLYDLRFRLFDAAAAGAQIGATLCADNVSLINGRFTVQLDFAAQFAGQQRFIEIDVRPDTGLNCANTAGFVLLSPRQPLTATPNALFSLNATTATTSSTAANASQLNGQAGSFYQNAANLTGGSIPDARLSGTYSGVLSLSNSGNAFAGAFSGSGAGLTALNATNITAGTLGDARLSANIPRLASNNIFSGANVFGAVGIGLGNAIPQVPLEVAASQAVARFVTSNSLNGSVLSLGNVSPGLSTTGGSLGAVNFESGIGTDGQIAYQWDAASGLNDSLQFRVGGLPWAALTGAGSLGIGVLDPAARLHVRNGLASMLPNPNSTIVMETAAGGYFNLITQNAGETGLLFGTPAGGAEDAGIIYNNPGATRGLQFRTGGNVTRMTIFDSGAVSIPGTLIAGTTVIDDVQYSTPKITFATITPADFSVVTNFNSVKSLGAGEYATIPGGFVSDQLTAGVHLPHGATITQVIVWMYDASPTKNLTGQFVQVDQLTRSPALRGTGTSSTSSIFSLAIDATPVPNLTINNESSFYRIVVSTANNQPWDGSLGVAGVRIEYRMTSPIP